MKIAVIGPHFPDSFARNICVTLKAIGHEVVSLAGTRTSHFQSRWSRAMWTILPTAIPGLEHRMYAHMVQEVGNAQPDLVLVTIGTLPPEIVESLKTAAHAPVVCWYTDAMANWHRQYLLASPWDAIFLKEPWAVSVLRNHLGQRAFYLPEAMNPMWHRRCQVTQSDRQKYGCDLLAQGTLHYYRARMLEPFVDYEMKIWGASDPPWLHSPAKLRYTNIFVGEGIKARVYACAKIALNIVNHLEIEGVNCSLFEYAGCGLFQIAEWKQSLPQLFEPEKEIVTYRDRNELKEKVDFYLSHSDLRQEIAARAYVRALAEHTYESRLQSLLRTITGK
jgi:spore maturation protein CgeB